MTRGVPVPDEPKYLRDSPPRQYLRKPPTTPTPTPTPTPNGICHETDKFGEIHGVFSLHTGCQKCLDRGGE